MTASIEAALLQERGSRRLDPESRDLARALERRGIPFTLFTAKCMMRRQLDVRRETLVAGEIPVVHAALKMLGVEPPTADDYPDVLRPFMHRRVWTSTVGDVITHFASDGGGPMFVKPRGRIKRFTGVVVRSPLELGALHGVSRHQEVYCAEVVRFVSEHRVYVAACAPTRATPRRIAR